MTTSDGSKSSAHYLSDTNRFDVSSKGPSSGISGPLLETSNLLVELLLPSDVVLPLCVL